MDSKLAEGNDRYLFRHLIESVAADPRNRDCTISDAGQQCTYAEMPALIERIAAHLRASDVRDGDCVTLEVNNSVRGALTVLALLSVGYSVMTLPVAGQRSRAREATTRYPRFSRVALAVDTARATKPLAETDPAEFLDVRVNEAYDSSARRPSADEPRLFFRTSGSTGIAKLATYRYRNFYLNALNALAVRGFDASHRIALPTPIFHVYGLGAGFLAGLAGGSSIDLQERSNILRFLEREQDFQPNVAYVTPTVCEMLIRGRRKPRLYDFMITSGDRISEATFRRCEDLHGPMINQYGATELGIVAAGRLDMPFEERATTVGSPVPGVECRIAPLPEQPDEDVGELQIRHDFGFEGYVGLDGETVVPPKAFADDWYRTGDLATLGAGGSLAVLGRCDLSVNRQGMLLPLAEVESRMRELDGVEEVAVAAGRQNMRGRALVAFCVLARASRTSGDSLRTGYAAVSPPYSVPEIVRIMPELPKLESGKVDRQALARLAEQEQLV